MSNCKCCNSGCDKEIRVLFCPKCKSRDVGYTFGLGNLFGVIPKMKCRDCGFDSPTFPVLITTDKKLKKTIEDMKKKRKMKKKIVKKTVGGKKK